MLVVDADVAILTVQAAVALVGAFGGLLAGVEPSMPGVSFLA